nr:hypothetical protein [Tanacetum cinerariifolium]
KVTESNAENLLPIPSKCEVTLEDKRECDLPISENIPVCDNHSDIFFDSKDDNDISVYDDFKDVEYVEASLSDPEIVSVEEENVVQHEEEEDNLSIPRPPPEPPDTSLLSAESEDTIFDPAQLRFSFPFALPKDELIQGSSRAHDSDLPPMIEVFLCWIFVPVSKIFTSFDLKLVWGSLYPLIYIA